MSKEKITLEQQRVVYQLFVVKVAEEIGIEKAEELLNECYDAVELAINNRTL